MTDRRIAVCICAALLVAFGAGSYFAAASKCATYDEPMHAVAADFVARHSDYRVDPEDPPLWQRWAMLGAAGVPLADHYGDAAWDGVFDRQENRTPLVRETMYSTPGNDADRLLMRLRGMLMVLGVALGAVVALWSWRLAGPVAAVTATALVAMDPTLLAHASAIKNDVGITLVGAGLAYATWRAGVRLTWANAAAVIALAAIAPVTKFSGPLWLFIVPAMLLGRVVLPGEWRVMSRSMTARIAKAGVALGLFGGCVVAAYGAIWASYSFRYAPTADEQTFDMPKMIERISYFEIAERHFREAGGERRADIALFQHTPEELAAWRPGPMVSTVMFLDRHRLLPQSWLYGLLFTYRDSRARLSYLCGKFSYVGFWDYFPLAYAFKTPLAELAAVGIAAVIGVSVIVRRRRASPEGLWAMSCIATPLVILGATILTANINIGIRHLLPVYPFLYVAIGCAAAYAWKQWGRNARIVLTVLAAAMAVEVGSAFPDYLVFFNVAAGGSRGGIHLLSDSNLDWGQDLPAMAAWQKAHPDRNLYLCYFGTAEPGYYGIQYASLPGSFDKRGQWDEGKITLPRKPGVMAVSATALQGVYYRQQPKIQGLYSLLAEQTPIEVLGGTIYLFEFDPR